MNIFSFFFLSSRSHLRQSFYSRSVDPHVHALSRSLFPQHPIPPPSLARKTILRHDDILFLLLRDYCHHYIHCCYHRQLMSSLPSYSHFLSLGDRARSLLLCADTVVEGGSRNGTSVQLRRAADAESFGFVVELAPHT